MQIREVMTTDPEYVKLETSLKDVAQRMRDLDVGMLPVGDGVQLKGMITDRDITIRATAEGLDTEQVKASDIMTPDVLYRFDDEDVENAIDTMKSEQVRRLIILNRDKDMVGIVALADIANETNDSAKKADALYGVSQG